MTRDRLASKGNFAVQLPKTGATPFGKIPGGEKCHRMEEVFSFGAGARPRNSSGNATGTDTSTGPVPELVRENQA